MATVSLDKEINSYLALLANKDKESILDYIKAYVKGINAGVTSERISIEQYNKEINEAEADMDAGNFTSQEDAEKLAGSWF